MSLFPIKQFPEEARIIFFGTPEFAVPPLANLIKAGYNITSIVTQPDRPKGRGRKISFSPVKQTGIDHGVRILQPQKASDKEFLAQIKKDAPDLMIVVAFGQILRKDLLSIPRFGVINIHASLLPKYRGAAPIQRAILNNETMTGLTVMRMEEGLDTGPVLYQEEVPIIKDETAGQLHDRLSNLAGDLIIRFMRVIGKSQIREEPQDDSKAVYADKIHKDMSQIQWDKDADRISALIRALDPVPGAVTTIGDNKIKLFSSRVVNEADLKGIPGNVRLESGGRMLVETGKGLVEIREVQYPGKKRMSSKEFLRGFPIPDGTILGK